MHNRKPYIMFYWCQEVYSRQIQLYGLQKAYKMSKVTTEFRAYFTCLLDMDVLNKNEYEILEYSILCAGQWVDLPEPDPDAQHEIDEIDEDLLQLMTWRR